MVESEIPKIGVKNVCAHERVTDERSDEMK